MDDEWRRNHQEAVARELKQHLDAKYQRAKEAKEIREGATKIPPEQSDAESLRKPTKEPRDLQAMFWWVVMSLVFVYMIVTVMSDP